MKLIISCASHLEEKDCTVAVQESAFTALKLRISVGSNGLMTDIAVGYKVELVNWVLERNEVIYLGHLRTDVQPKKQSWFMDC